MKLGTNYTNSKLQEYRQAYLFIVLIIIASGIMLFISDDIQISIHVSALGLLSVGSCVIVKFDIMHPYCWYSIFFFLYSTSYSILYSQNGLNMNFGYSKRALVCCWIAQVVFLLVVSPKSYRSDNPLWLKEDIKTEPSAYLDIVINMLGAFLLFSAALALGIGATKKGQIYNANNPIIRIALYFSIIVPVIFTYQYYSKSRIKGNADISTIIRCGVPVCLFGFILGERDVYLRFLLILVITSFHLGFIKKKYLFVIVPIGILILIFSKAYKYYALSGNTGVAITDYSVKGIFLDFLSVDFTSAGRNLQLVVTTPGTKGFFKGEGLINEFVRVFVNTDFGSHSSWYNRTIVPFNHAAGYGFTIVGSGYAEFGFAGIVLVFTIISLMIKTLYKHASRNIYTLLLYVFAIPTYIYAIRQDLANILSPMIKHAFFAVLAVYFCVQLERNNYSQKQYLIKRKIELRSRSRDSKEV